MVFFDDGTFSTGVKDAVTHGVLSWRWRWNPVKGCVEEQILDMAKGVALPTKNNLWIMSYPHVTEAYIDYTKKLVENT